MDNSRYFSLPGSERTFDRNKMLLVLLVSMAMTLLQVSSVTNLLPSIEQSVGATTTDVQWILSGYALATGLLLVPTGRIGDLAGHSKMWMGGIVVFTLASLGIGLSNSPLLLNAGRIFQGIGAGMYAPQITGIIQHYFQGQARARAFAFLGLTIAISVALGPIISGTFVHFLGEAGWRWSFLANVPLGIFAFLLGTRWLPFSKRPALNQGLAVGGRRARRAHIDLDPVGILLLVGIVLTVMLPEMIQSPWRWWLFLATPFFAAAWVWWEGWYERAGHHPMVSLSLFRIESYAGGTLITALQFLGMTSVWVVVAISTQQGLGVSALEAGLIGLPNAVVSGAAAMWSGKHALRRGRTVQVWSLVAMLAGILATIPVAYAVFTHGASFWWLSLPLALEGFGAGAISSANQTQSMLDVPAEEGGTAGGFQQTTQRIATAIGNAVITAILFSQVTALNSRSTSAWFSGFAWAYGTISMIITIATIFAVIYRRNGRRMHLELLK